MCQENEIVITKNELKEPAIGAKPDDYVYGYDEKLPMSSHFSSLLLSGEWVSTGMEIALLGGLSTAAVCLPAKLVDVPGSMPLKELATFMCVESAVRRVYNAYLEAAYFAFPAQRTQPPAEHALKSERDICGRDRRELDALVWHDRLTLLSQFALNVTLYYVLPGYFPVRVPATRPLYGRAITVVLNHYVMSFGMYWMHRALHVNGWLWKHIHSLHHWAKHPLSRNTYQDHWVDNFANSIVGFFFAQVLVPLDNGCFWSSHVFRILESLEKHSGISCHLNVAHSLQQCLPCAQMPHHHDWHHEGHKGCNYTFSSIGGLWDCLFGTRKPGRAVRAPNHMTVHDREMLAAPPPPSRRKNAVLDHPVLALLPVVAVGAAVVTKLCLRKAAA